MKEQIEKDIKQIIHALYDFDVLVQISPPPSKEMGDFAVNIAFSLAKQVKKSPLVIAEAIVQELEKMPSVEKASVIQPGFINIFVDKNAFVDETLQRILSTGDACLSLDIGNGKKVSVEHTAANPNKHLHIGHLRNFATGDAVVRLLRHCGYTVMVQDFNNDQGLQIAKVLWGFLHRDLVGSVIGEEDMKFDHLAGEIYVRAEKAITENAEYETAVRNIIQKMEEGNNEMALYAEEITRKILLAQLETLSYFSVYYDEFISDGCLTQSGEVAKIVAKLIELGKAVKETEGKNAGCVVIKHIVDAKGLPVPDKVLLRSDGTAGYTAKDIVLLLWKFGLMDVFLKFEPLAMQKNGKEVYITTYNHDRGTVIKEHAEFHINVVDQRQSYALEVVTGAMELLGFVTEAKHAYHLAYETVALSPKTARKFNIEVPDSSAKWIAMSGRKGIEVSLDSLLDMMTDLVSRGNADKEEKLSHEEARSIAASALRYAMVKYGYNTVIVFDLEDALSPDGDSGVYLMYAYVRANRILQKAGTVEYTTYIGEIPASIMDIITELAYAEEILLTAAKDFRINRIAEYTYGLAKLFSSFYQNVNVMNETDAAKRQFYISFILSFTAIYGQLLDILGIYRPEKM